MMRMRKAEDRNQELPHGVGFFLFSIFCFLASGLTPAFADESSPQPTFTLTLADGTTSSGTLEQIGENWSVRLGGAVPVQAIGMDAISLRRDKKAICLSPRTEQVILANGDRMPASVRELKSDRLLVHGDFGKDDDITLPLSAVALLWMTTPDGVDHSDRWRRRLLAEKRSRDIVYLRNGDVMEGIVNSIVAAQGADAARSATLQIELAKKDVALPFNKIAVVAFNTELVRSLLPKGFHGRLVLDNGARLTLASATSDGHAIIGKTLFGGLVSISMDRVIALDWLGGCAVYLSDMNPRSYQFRSFMGGVNWPYVKDASVEETDITLGGKQYDKGLGVHTSSRLVYALDPDVRSFEAVVGMDDRIGKEGSAHVQVLLDGKAQKLAWDGKLTGGGKPRILRVPISGAKELALAAEFGDFGDVQGCVDWADARLIRKQKIEDRK